MSRFQKYFLMSEKDVKEYVVEKLENFNRVEDLKCEEIGDGNLNYVFRVIDSNGESVIIKQAGTTARISDEFKLSTNRIKIESNALQIQEKLARGLTPKVFLFDEIMYCCIMEDLSDHKILRDGLINHEIFPQLADDLTTFMVNTLLLTSDVVMEHKEKKELVKKFINTELCEISENLVFTEPFNDYNHRNSLFEGNESWIIENIYDDELLNLEAAKLKFGFMNNAQALIHGDLHTGSVFVRDDSTKVIDPEFAFFGPIGYDVGNVVANLVFAWANGKVNDKEEFVNWVEATIRDVVDMFIDKFNDKWDKHVKEIMASTPGFKEWYLRSILEDTAGVAGLEITRRIVGLAKVKDITSIEDSLKRMRAERGCLTIAKDFILNRSTFLTGYDYIKRLNQNL